VPLADDAPDVVRPLVAHARQRLDRVRVRLVAGEDQIALVAESGLVFEQLGVMRLDGAQRFQQIGAERLASPSKPSRRATWSMPAASAGSLWVCSSPIIWMACSTRRRKQ
jgi:hypothetical protein